MIQKLNWILQYVDPESILAHLRRGYSEYSVI